MEEILLQNSAKEILEKCKVNNSNVVFILNLAKLESKRGRKSYADMTDDELYEDYKKRCERQGHQVLSRKIWNEFQIDYDYEDLLSTEDVEEKDFKNQPEPKSIKLGYIGEELDSEAIDSLYKLLFKALKKRLVILLDLEGVPGIINTALHCRHQGYDCKGVNSLMNSKITEVRKLLEDPDIKEWLATGASDMSLDASDYVATYQRVLRQISDIRDEHLEYFRDIIHNEYDIFEEEILSNEILEISNFSDNLDYENEDEDILD